MTKQTWTVPARVVRVIDGDTVVVDLDLGWRVYRNGEHIRIAGIDAPELNTDSGKAARDYARTLLKPGDLVFVRSEAKPSFERTIGSITIPDADQPAISYDFAAEMLTAGHAIHVT